jgi:hypothetical protein
MIFRHSLVILLELVTCFSHEWLKTSLIQQFTQIPYIYNYTFYALKWYSKNHNAYKS